MMRLTLLSGAMAVLACLPTPAGGQDRQTVTLNNGVTGDGELEVKPDAYGAITLWDPGSPHENEDWYDPTGDDERNNCAFATSVFLYNPVTQDRVALAEPGWDLDDSYNQNGSNWGAGTLSYEIVTPLSASDSDDDGFDDTATSSFRVFGGNGNYDLTFDLLQTVSKPNAEDVSTLKQIYTITNNAGEPATFLFDQHDDLDLMFDFLAEDCAGAASAGGVRHVYMREADVVPNYENLVVALSGTPGYDYCAGRSGFDPDGAGPDPAMAYGSDAQIWQNYGLPDSWKNYVAGVGYNMDGILGEQRPPGSASPYDGFMDLQWEVGLTRADSTDIEVITTYGSDVPVSECAGDIDGDGDTDHSDLGALLAAWCTHEGDPNWNPNADLDGDGHVGHGDLGILLSDWGCGAP